MTDGLPQVRALSIGRSVPLRDGRKVFGALSEDGESYCFELTATNDVVTRLALSREAFGAMIAIAYALAPWDEENPT